MCGIVGYIGKRDASRVLLDGLRRLEYRGYDSAGVAVLLNGTIQLKRSAGKLIVLEENMTKTPLTGSIGIGHTRWATHGRPCEENAHPHLDCTGKLVVVHNGIIENYAGLKENLKKTGHTFRSQTDTEVLAHLIEEELSKLKNAASGANSVLLTAVRQALTKVEGAYAIGVMSAGQEEIVAAKKDCPLIIGTGNGECFLASDIPAILPYTRQIIYLSDNQTAVLHAGTVKVHDVEGNEVTPVINTITWDPVQAEKAGYKHFMLKEIYEQPTSIEDTLRGRLGTAREELVLEDFAFSDDELKTINKVTLVACGTSYHACMVGKLVLENLGKLSCEVDIASEYRYRQPLVDKNTLFVAISQSGETADTIAAMRYAKNGGARTTAICNVIGSTIAREAQTRILTRCGPEIGVASTKAFTGQLTCLYLLALRLSLARNELNNESYKSFSANFKKAPGWIKETLALNEEVKDLAKKFFKTTNFLYLGRHLNYPIALEGALKLKEISYIHAEGYPAGEMKHGPIALIDEHMPVVAIATDSRVHDKILSNIEEAQARGGIILAIASHGNETIKKKAEHVLYVPQTPELFSPFVTVIPLQLLAYHIALLRGCDVDQPRNLAKSVTVE